jgi:2-amino-4-hydroxy-6-hydroxymethyldihydropteridine diphosphokinase
MNQAVLLIGGNLGDRFVYLMRCQQLISEQIGCIIAKSSIYETMAWGVTAQQDFLNQAFLVETALEPFEVLKVCQNIEETLDRIRVIRWGERTMDVDIIFYNDLIINDSELEIPHPRYHLRNFALEPLNELIKDFICPINKKSIKQLLAESLDSLEANKI